MRAQGDRGARREVGGGEAEPKRLAESDLLEVVEEVGDVLPAAEASSAS